MVYPTLNIEKKLWAQGYSYIAGVDEVGRGAWAGPVVAAAVIFPRNANPPSGIKDSKLLTARKREDLSEQIKEAALAFAVGEVSVSVIEKEGIAPASQLAMQEAIQGLKPQADFFLTDYFPLRRIKSARQKNIKKGDLYCVSIAAASIVAKVYRDARMREFDYNENLETYQFGKHKGYGTKFHQEMICEHGCSKVHRLSFIPRDLKWQISKVKTKY